MHKPFEPCGWQEDKGLYTESRTAHVVMTGRAISACVHFSGRIASIS